MSAKRYKAADMRRALQMVREDLGADAVILSTTRTDAGFEVVACGDREWKQASGGASTSGRAPASPDAARQGVAASAVAASVPVAQEVSDVRPAAEAPRATDEPEIDRAAAPVTALADRRAAALEAQMAARLQESEHLVQDMRDELRELRDWLEFQWQQSPAAETPQAKAYEPLKRRLDHLGVPSALHTLLLRDTPTQGDERLRWRSLMGAWAKRIRCLQEDERPLFGHLALVGPSGAGKTTTLQKLAVRHVLQYGSEQVGVISLDSERIGAHQSLAVFCRMMDIPLKVAQDRNTLDLALRSLRNRQLVLIDIPGNHIGSGGQQHIFDMLRSFPSIQTLLTIPCTAQYNVMRAWWQSTRILGPMGMVLTKVDEAQSLGEALGLCVASQLPLSWITDGPEIPKDLRDPAPHRLLARAVELARLGDRPAGRQGHRPVMASV